MQKISTSECAVTARVGAGQEATPKGRAAILLGVILASFVLLQFLLPLRTAVKIGADEGFELAKATLWLKGYKMYTEVWNDQPPLHTFLIMKIAKHLTPSVLGPRVMTIALALMLLTSVFLVSFRVHGEMVAALATIWLIASPGFVELSASVMLEIPALALVLATLCVLMVGPARWHLKEILGGVLFAAALQMKLIGIIYLPLIGIVLWLQNSALQPAVNQLRRSSILTQFFPAGLWASAVIFGASLALSFVAIDWLIEEGAYLRHFKQSWLSHFGPAQSFEYGSAADHPFDWSVLLKNWDTTFPAALGAVIACRQIRITPLASIPAAWLFLTLVVFASHKPWWSYYYVHNAVPFCWCAAVGIAGIVRWIRARHKLLWTLLLTIVFVGMLCWQGARVYLQISSIRQSPQIYTALVLDEIERLKPYTTFIYAEQSVYSFYAGIPLPPKLGVTPFKRFWSGELTNARLVEELQSVQPGLLLLNNDTRELPFNELIKTQYRLIYEDSTHRLYAHKNVLVQAKQSRARQ